MVLPIGTLFMRPVSYCENAAHSAARRLRNTPASRQTVLQVTACQSTAKISIHDGSGCVMSITEYARYDGLGLAELVAKKKVKPSELVDEAIRRAEAGNPKLNAVVFTDYER